MYGGGGWPGVGCGLRHTSSHLSFPFAPPDPPSLPCGPALRTACPHQLPHARFEALPVEPGSGQVTLVLVSEGEEPAGG